MRRADIHPLEIVFNVFITMELLAYMIQVEMHNGIK